ncbi:MAG: response regulator [Nitrospiraceae bacterium]|nr:response regulator [Nitrospiraceae bacterium]
MSGEILATRKVLIADDNANIREVLTYLLEDEGFELLAATDGNDTLRKVREFRPDVLFLDIMMPEVNGYDICRAIKSDPELRGTYVIMLTAKGQAVEQERGRMAGADRYIVKPFSPMEILVILKNLFAGK